MDALTYWLGTMGLLGFIFGALALLADFLEESEEALRNRYEEGQ